MIIVDPLISSTRLAIVAEADLPCDSFLSEKGCRHKLVVSSSFWSWLLNVSSVLTSLSYTALFFGLLMRFEYTDGSLEFWVFDFGIYVSEICLFFVFILDALFYGTFFFIFQDSVWLVKKS